MGTVAPDPGFLTLVSAPGHGMVLKLATLMKALRPPTFVMGQRPAHWPALQFKVASFLQAWSEC